MEGISLWDTLFFCLFLSCLYAYMIDDTCSIWIKVGEKWEV